ncbi:reverse transcriptase domain-containing protein [Bacillus methanolicus]|nr:reverse transcriptase domain-containing protein [Bacillus methanolicus]
MDTIWEKQFAHLGELIRYADDFVIMCNTKQQALQSIDVVKSIMKKLDLTINKDKSRLVNIWDDKSGFDFLGMHHRIGKPYEGKPHVRFDEGKLKVKRESESCPF